MEDVWKVRMNICTALWSFVNFCCLSQSEVNTDNRKVSTFFAFQHVRCRCMLLSFLSGPFLKRKVWCGGLLLWFGSVLNHPTVYNIIITNNFNKSSQSSILIKRFSVLWDVLFSSKACLESYSNMQVSKMKMWYNLQIFNIYWMRLSIWRIVEILGSVIRLGRIILQMIWKPNSIIYSFIIHSKSFLV